jgi:hypothetical protein
MNYTAQLIDWFFPHAFTAHDKVIIHSDHEDPSAVVIDEEHTAHRALLRKFSLVELYQFTGSAFDLPNS